MGERKHPRSGTTFVVLSFEGPDPYSHGGGLGTRAVGLSKALSRLGFETHLFFIGDPDLPGDETIENGKLRLHRWCQWISRYHPGGVYDGEEGKLSDWNHSLSTWLVSEMICPTASTGGTVIVLAEEWHTAASVVALHDILLRLGLRDRARLLWNANNTFGFYRVPWHDLRNAAVITTVSRYMKHLMWNYGVDPRVIPNGIPTTWLKPIDGESCRRLSTLFDGRLTLAKVARWDPDKRWEMAVDTVSELKRIGLRPVFLARGGVEEHKREVMARAERQALGLAHVRWSATEVEALIEAIQPAVNADMIVLESYLSEEQRRALFHVADAVLANSGIEPFGLVGLEAMAVGGIAFVGSTGEDYATNGHDAICLQTNDPREIVHHLSFLRSSPKLASKLRLAARSSARRHTWESIVKRLLLPFLGEMGVDFRMSPPVKPNAKLEARPGSPKETKGAA